MTDFSENATNADSMAVMASVNATACRISCSAMILISFIYFILPEHYIPKPANAAFWFKIFPRAGKVFIIDKDMGEESQKLFLQSTDKSSSGLERELRESLKELKDIKFALDQSTIVAITDQTGKITFANDKFCEISKFSRIELIGQDHRIINSGFHSKEFIRNLWTTIAGGRVPRRPAGVAARDEQLRNVLQVVRRCQSHLRQPGHIEGLPRRRGGGRAARGAGWRATVLSAGGTAADAAVAIGLHAGGHAALARRAGRRRRLPGLRRPPRRRERRRAGGDPVHRPAAGAPGRRPTGRPRCRCWRAGCSRCTPATARCRSRR